MNNSYVPLRKVKVMHVINCFTLAGAEKLVYDITKRMDPDRYEVSICSMHEKKDELEVQIRRELESAGVRTHTVSKPVKTGRLAAILRLARLFRHVGTEIVHTHCGSPDFYGKLAARLAGVPKVFTTLHNSEGYSASREHMLSRLTTKYVSISDRVHRYALDDLGIDHRKLTLVFNGIDISHHQYVEGAREQVDERFGLPKGAQIVLNVGRLTEQKGQLVLMKAAPRILSEIPNAHFLLVGDDITNLGYTVKVRAMIQELGLSKRVTFAGLQRDIPTLVSAADAFVFPSLWEGLPLIMLEVMSIGTPIVAASVGSIPELIQDGDNGMLVPPGEDTALATKVIEILSDKDRSTRLAENAKRRITEQFNVDVTAQRYSELYANG